MAQRKIILLMDSALSLNELSKFALNHVFTPQDLGVALLHNKVLDFDLTKVFDTNRFLNLEYSYSEIFEKFIIGSDLPTYEKEQLLAALTKHKVQPRLYFDESSFLKNLYEESLFADMVLCNTKTAEKLLSYKSDDLRAIGNYLYCPLLIIPDTARDVKNIFLVFDGKPSSMKAIKDFNYTLSHLYKGKNVTILSTMNNSGREQYEDRLLMQYAKLNIPDVAFMKISGNELRNVVDYAKKSTDSMIVVGTNLSVDDEKSINELRTDLENQPVFITKN